MPESRSSRKTFRRIKPAYPALSRSLLALAFAALACPHAPAQLTVPPRQWAVAAAANEVAILQHADSFLRYRMHIVDQKGDQVRDVIESKDGTVARLILRDNRALTPEEDAAERDRLNDMIASPGAYAKHVKSEDSGKKMAADLIQQMPDAMLYTYAAPPPRGDAGAVVLDYHPNPDWSPPTTTAGALTGLEGRMWIDARTHTLLRMEGRIFKPVNLGWGMLAHIYPGGQLVLEQTNPTGQRWIYKHFNQDVTVRALMLKTIAVHTTVDASAFQVIPPVPYQEAIRQLLATPLPKS